MKVSQLIQEAYVEKMDFKNTYTEWDGRIWRVETIRKAAKNLPVFKYNINKISLDNPVRWKSDNLRDYLVHYDRIIKANLNDPIILSSNGKIMDGWHRFIKAKIKKMQQLPAVQFEVDPKHDFKK